MVDEEPCITLSEERTSQQKTDFFTANVTGENCLRVLCASTHGSTFEGNSGSVARVTLVADDDLSDGDYAVVLQNAILAANAGGVKLDATSFIINLNQTTSIEDIHASDVAAFMYDLTGRRIESSCVRDSKGIYILNGKKILK